VSAYADTSVLLSLQVADANAREAFRLIDEARGGLVWTQWQRVEFNNALRALLCRQQITPAQFAGVERSMRTLVESGHLRACPLPAYALWQEAEKLSITHTPRLGVRTLDLLHVAAARVLHCKRFLTFDHRQAALASAAGFSLRLTP
jgi:predicted nucleic acid-binding protein